MTLLFLIFIVFFYIAISFLMGALWHDHQYDVSLIQIFITGFIWWTSICILGVTIAYLCSLANDVRVF